MSLSVTEKTNLQNSVQNLSDQVNALQIDTVDVAALQAQVADLQNQVALSQVVIAGLQAKIDAAKVALA